MRKLVFFCVAMATLMLCGCGGGRHDAPDSLYATSRPYTRWWWFASQIEKSDVRDQLIWLRDHGFGGVEIAWIYPMGLDSATAHPAFLSPEWAEGVLYAKHVADSLGLGCDFTYGTLWPFSDVDLPCGDQTRDYFDTIEPARRPYTWDFPREARILNHLDCHAFARYAEKLNAALGEAYKGGRSGLFVDSWEVETQYLWTPGFGDTFMQQHGYDIKPYMESRTLLNPANNRVFYDYMHTLSGFVLREFYKPFAANAAAQGAFSRAQCGGAPTDLLTAFGLVDVPESEAILYEPPYSKIVASAATLAGRDVVTAETFTCAYGWTSLRYNNGRGHSPYQGKEQPADLKLICDALFANGVNQIIWHGFPYNKIGDTSNFFYTTCQISTSPQHNLTGNNLADFNRYMTRVSQYMRRGSNYSDVAVYIPLEDSWMGGFYPDSLRKVKAFFWGQYEMRYVDTPKELKGCQPLWVNEHYLASASYSDGLLHCGQATFASLYCGVQYMEYSALRHLLRLAAQGLPVCMAALPQEPGRVLHGDYSRLLDSLLAMPNVGRSLSALGATPLLEGDDLPDFWCRKEGDVYYIFFANPLSQTIEYPLDYCYAFTDRGAVRNITVNHHGRREPYTLRFEPTQSLMLKVDCKGIHPIDLGYTPPRL